MNNSQLISTAGEKRPLFVISDLHLGDGSARDNLLKHNKHLLFHRFLDEVERQNGLLIILGDLLELWRYKCEYILEQWHRLFARLAQIDMFYVPGNHDPVHEDSFKEIRTMHSFFDKIQHPFTKTIGGRRFRFMHGHEVDPLVSTGMLKFSPILKVLTGSLEFRRDMCLITSDRFSDLLLEAGERIIHFWQKLSRRINTGAFEHLGLNHEAITHLKRPVRTRNMLARFYAEQQEGLYDVTITGHTHKAGSYGQWYYNCGSWTQKVVNYVKIESDGRIHVCNWTFQGPEHNRVSIF